jgi:hypothetical protein
MKGDKIMVRLATGGGQTCVETVTAAKAGRTVRQRWSGKWVYVEQMTRTGKVVGGTLRVLASAVLAVADAQVEPTPPGGKAAKIVRSAFERTAKAEAAIEATLDGPSSGTL